MTTDATEQAATSDVRVRGFEPLPTPRELIEELPLPAAQISTVARGRLQTQAVTEGTDDRLLVIVGPCSIHDPAAGLEYAQRLAEQAERHRDQLLIVMRTYFEKPRTTVGWKGLINDPHLDGSYDIATGLGLARRFLLDVTALGLPAATEFLEPISPQYLADLVSWGAIGARTTESQIHRQLASGLSMPIGFKNGTDGSVQVAIDGCIAARAAQSFLGINVDGRACLVSTTGNPDAHLILRGGTHGPNYSAEQVAQASRQLASKGLNPRLLVDASHGNSGKNFRKQAEVVSHLAGQVAAGGSPIAGVMLESFLLDGAQPLDTSVGRQRLNYGQSVTDECLGWELTETVLAELAEASRNAQLRRG